MFCMLCQVGSIPKNLQEKGFIWVHLDCMMKLFDFKSDMESIKEFLEGKRTNESVESFLERMAEFDKKADNTIKLLKETGMIK